MAFKFYASVAKGLKIKVRKSWELNLYVYRSNRGKTGRGAFFHTPSPVLSR